MIPIRWISWWISRITMSLRRKSIGGVIGVKDGTGDKKVKIKRW
jgi:hypothetical protein